MQLELQGAQDMSGLQLNVQQLCVLLVLLATLILYRLCVCHWVSCEISLQLMVCMALCLICVGLGGHA